MLTKRQKSLISMASRNCGLSYRSACRRGTFDSNGNFNGASVALELKRQGYLTLSDNGKDRGRFVFWATEKGKEALKGE